MKNMIKVTALAVACVCVIPALTPVQALTNLSDPVTIPKFKAKQVKPEQDDNKKSGSQTTKKKKPARKTLKSYINYQAAHNRVNVSCFPAKLRNVLAKVRARYGTTAIVSSGYRSRNHNRRVGGARRSMHVQCKAADIRVPGVGKYTLARYLKSLSGVGGVGTYGCNKSVHVDVGPKRQWHWRCRRRG